MELRWEDKIMKLKKKFEKVSSDQEIATILERPDFSDVFSDSNVPSDPHEVVSQGERYMHDVSARTELAHIAALIVEQDIQIVSDFDGTVSPFVKNPDDVVFDQYCFDAFKRINEMPNSSVVFLTGRDPKVLRPLVADDNGRVPFSIIGSHGVISQAADDADGTISPLKKLELTAEEQEIVEKSSAVGDALEGQYPNIVIERKSGNGINVNVTDVADGQKSVAISDARKLLGDLLKASPVMEGGRPVFVLANESAVETCIRNERFNKANALTAHGLIDTNMVTIFCCDSLGTQGTDNLAAARINSPDFPYGLVFHVRNGRKECYPPEGSENAPAAVFANPAQLGKFFQFVVSLKDERKQNFVASPKIGGVEP
jgi:hypothetical protein